MLPDTDRFLSWLDHGARLALELKGDSASHRDTIWCLIEEAVETIDRSPDQDRRWLTSGLRSGGWSMVGMSKSELRDLERIRFLSSMKPYDGNSTTLVNERNAEERAMDVLGWLRWFKGSKPVVMQKAAVALARRGDNDSFYRIWCPHRRIGRAAVLEFKTRCAGFIQSALREHGIIPAQAPWFMVEASIVS